ncbi:PD40 domain-containing protein [Pantoea endophytica]|uniref:PD40 domain-containing protein n=1 Tax=Pantoea endophytica TaxID=92488 RepID=UPI001AE6005B|nr:PD40 domain-containing protein [Pantoea endophytica]
MVILLVPDPLSSNVYAASAATVIKSQFNLQGIYYDKEGNLFTLEQNYKNNVSMIFYNHDGYRELLLKDTDIGHQGFGVSTLEHNSAWYILTGMKKSGLHILLYKLKNKNKPIKYRIKLFPDSFTPGNETMPALSDDGRFIFARGRSKDGQMFIRAFDTPNTYSVLKDINNIDLSDNYLYQWPISSRIASNAIGSLQPLQAIASNGHDVALMFGNARLTPKVIYFYTVNGELKRIDTRVTPGIEDAMVFSQQNFYEPEGLSYQKNRLKILITYAKGINKRNVIYNYIK